METLNVMFRYNKEYDMVEMMYIDEYDAIVSVSQQEGHNECAREYVEDNTTPLPIDLTHKATDLINYYANSPEPIECVTVESIF